MSTSFYEDASLVMIPSGYKTSKVYSAKPTTGSGDLDFTRSNDTATRVGPDGLIEKVRTNLALYSEDLTNVIYAKSNATVTSNSETAPDGTLTADTITATSAFGQVQGAVVITSGIVYTMSVWLKRKTGTGQVSLRGVSNTSTPITITSDWVRYSVSLNAADTSGRYGVILNTSGDEVYAWGFQLEVGDVMTDYIPTTSAAVSVGPVANVPRLDYLNSSCPKLNLEPQRTNSCLWSENFDNVAWSKTNTSVTANTAISPDGYQNAELITETTTNGAHFCGYVYASVTSGTTYTTSVFLKKTTGSPDWMQLAYSTTGLAGFANFNLSTGAVGNVISGGSAKIENYGNGWYRCSLTQTANATGTGGGPVIVFTNNTNPNQRYVTYAGSTSVSILAWGAQLEAGAYATSYIPTLGAAVTRGADAASKTGISSLIGQTEGTLFVEFNSSNVADSSNSIFGISNGTTSNRVLIYLASNRIDGQVRNAGVTQAGFVGVTMAANTTYKCAIAYKDNDVAFYINGTQIGLDTIATIPAMSDARFDSGGGATNCDVPVSQAILFKTRLTNAQLAELTTL